MNISNVSTYVKAKHKETKKTKPVFFRSKLVPISCFSIVLVIVLVLTVLNIGNNTEGPIKNKVKVPTIATSIEEAYAFDINKDLINCYNVIKKDVETLIEKLNEKEKEFI